MNFLFSAKECSIVYYSAFPVTLPFKENFLLVSSIPGCFSYKVRAMSRGGVGGLGGGGGVCVCVKSGCICI